MNILHLNPYSPWSERARWALDHHDIPYAPRVFVPMASELRVRASTGRLRGRLTVPILDAEGEVVADSASIARWADRHGSGASLFPSALSAEIDALVAGLEPALCAGRNLVVRAVADDEEALLEDVPRAFRWSRPLALGMAKQGIHYFVRKYDLDRHDRRSDVETLREALAFIRASHAEHDGTMLGTFTFADLAAATLVQMIAPVADAFLPVSAATRRTWTRSELAAEFADVVAARDELYARRRRTAGRADR